MNQGVFQQLRFVLESGDIYIYGKFTVEHLR